ncbi:MAG TPA: hypothetical protein VGO47_04290 [Chlamydiales bacterium]|nr:hypothetical protein [Chlamydiales bacterium]
MVNIPTELFIQIIREATRMPKMAIQAPNRDFLLPSEALLARSALTMRHLSEIYRRKLSICLVSRLFNDICQRFTYEFLIIRRGESIPFLLEKLINHSIDPSLVLRIDILSISINRKDERLIPIPLLTKLVMLCQELRAFAVQTRKFYTDNAHLAHALAKLPRLEHLFVQTLWDGVFYKQLLLQMSAYSSAMVFLGSKKRRTLYRGLIVAERLSGKTIT